ncbi:MAG: hypothetical protein GXY74_10790 [Phycisphaerae bacterium]|nr:hypothetical protein [Phycisphaerae bacterium]
MSERFVDTFHCRSHVHCRHCRDLEAGRPWRQSLTARFTLPADAPDWACPEGLPWNVPEADVPGDLRAAEKKPCGCSRGSPSGQVPVTRVSCLECCEKHLGAAWVLLAEVRDGYASRLRAIGHLHEAEDESQAWPELHDAIREARKAYQQTGQMPSFDALAALVQACRQSTE